MSKRYAMERGYLDRLRAGRLELFAYAREVRNADDLRASRDELMASVQINRTPTAESPLVLDVRDGVAHIPVVGQLTPSADPCGAWMGMAETEYGFIQAAIIAAEDDKSVREIALDIDSPGGYLDGLDETAQILGAVSKPTTSYVGNLAASAAYWLASQTDRIVALSPASEVGSIGVAAEEYDDDQALANNGIVHRVYTSTDAPDKRPDTKTEEGRAKIVANLDAAHEIFVRRVAEGRGVTPEKVSKDFGRGAVVIAERAMAVGMIDEVRGSHISRPKENIAGVAGIQAAGPKNKKEGRMELTIDQIKAEAPNVAAALRDEGAKDERARIMGLEAWSDINADCAKIVAEAKASGKRYEDVAAQLGAAAAKGRAAPAANGENAPAVATGTAGNASGADDVLDDVDREAAALFGYDAATAKKFKEVK